MSVAPIGRFRGTPVALSDVSASLRENPEVQKAYLGT